MRRGPRQAHVPIIRCANSGYTEIASYVIFLLKARGEVNAGRDPRVNSYNRIRNNAEVGTVGLVEAERPSHVRLLEAMADPSMHRPVVQGSEVGGAIPPPFRTEDSRAAGRLGEIPRVPGPPSSATAGTAALRAGDAQAMATPELGAESTFWLRPADPVPAPGTVRFDAGLHDAAVESAAPSSCRTRSRESSLHAGLVGPVACYARLPNSCTLCAPAAEPGWRQDWRRKIISRWRAP